MTVTKFTSEKYSNFSITDGARYKPGSEMYIIKSGDDFLVIESDSFWNRILLMPKSLLILIPGFAIICYMVYQIFEVFKISFIRDAPEVGLSGGFQSKLLTLRHSIHNLTEFSNYLLVVLLWSISVYYFTIKSFDKSLSIDYITVFVLFLIVPVSFVKLYNLLAENHVLTTLSDIGKIVGFGLIALEFCRFSKDLLETGKLADSSLKVLKHLEIIFEFGK